MAKSDLQGIRKILNEETPYFEERADYIEKSQLLEWTAKGDFFEKIQKKLIGLGAKLLVGPRGTGKTHQMRCAYYSCLDNKEAPLPIYVSFNRYLRLEAYLSKTSNAIDIFHSWVLAKIVIEIAEEHDISLDMFSFNLSQLKQFVDESERQIERSEHDLIIAEISVESVKQYIGCALGASGRRRAILLLDDAALTLTHDYMIEFFDIFRSLKSTNISPKASVYPGTTQYGPRFHIGHDAEVVPAWLNVDDSGYTKFMDVLLTKRIHEEVEVPKDIMELLKYASFGVPRAFIMMLREYSESDRGTAQAKYNAVLQQRKESVLAEYKSIGQKVPQFSKIIDSGEYFFLETVEQLRLHNYQNIEKKGGDYKKTIIVGLTEIPSRADRMFQFLVEAGLLHELQDVSHGSDRRTIRFIPHLAILLQARIFTKSRGFNASEIAKILNGKSEKHPMRRSFYSLLSEDQVNEIALNLPPCANCSASRISEKQKFCHNCGKVLVEVSAFESCMKTPLQDLPLTAFQKNAIKKHTKFKTVEDVLTCQDPATELKKAEGIGAAYAERIFLKVNSWVDEFLV